MTMWDGAQTEALENNYKLAFEKCISFVLLYKKIKYKLKSLKQQLFIFPEFL